MKKLLLLLFIPLSCFSAFAQSFQIMQYGIKEGLPHESTYSIIQDKNGYIWISTTQGICRLDGKIFTSRFLGDTLPATVANTSFRDSKNRLWFGHKDGVISLFDQNRFKVFYQKGVEKSSIVGFAEDASGTILAMTQQKGLISINSELELTYLPDPFEGLFVSHFFITSEGNLLVGGFDGLTLFRTSDEQFKYEKVGKIQEIPYARVMDIVPGKKPDTYWLGTDEDGLFLMSGSGDKPSDYKVEKIGDDQGLEYSIVNKLLIDGNGHLWVSDYGVGIYRFKVDENNRLTEKLLFNSDAGLPEQYIEDLLKDDEGNIWFASKSSGLAILRDQAFTFYNKVGGMAVPEITAISNKDDAFWLGSRNGKLYLAGPNEKEHYREFSAASGLPAEDITALWQDEEGNLFIGTQSSGIYLIKKGSNFASRFFIADNSLGNAINAIDGTEEALWLATNDGVYRVDRKDQSITHQTTRTGLPHNVINDILIDSKGAVWIATKGSGIYCVSEDDPSKDITVEGNPKLEFVSLAEDANGRIWAGTAEDGVFKFAKDSLVIYNATNGLRSRYTYAVEVDATGFVWVGHRLGLSKIDPKSGNVVVFNQEMGFTSDVLARSICASDNGKMLFGTNNGLILYDAFQSRMDTVAPRLNISELNISDSIYDATSDIRLPYGAYKMRIDFVGINLSNPEQVTYRYKLDGFDDWSEPTGDTYAKYSRIEDGNYTFMLSACDGNGNCTGEVAMLKISVKIPVWKAWWFIISIFLIAIATVYFIIKIRERNQKALQEYLETQLEERTREVIHQKEEIEIKNRDITDSINYAQRIQASILPPIQRLHNTFDGSFVFYQPRDIVSGDFYWYDKLDNERFLIVCADSTGHGVPGAFMSMIGTTLIKDICLRSHVKTPSDVLLTLDNEIREALNQNKETDGSNDGMDIIVAEINLRTNKFIVSSAMRPVILYKGGEQIYVKGSRSSVGGQLDMAGEDKDFVNEEFQLSKGDIIYMFSDGYPDQFGGPLGRKFKMVRLKNLLRDIHDKPMQEQYNYVKSNFFLWKEDLEQVDDVLFMGIKI